MKRTLLSLGLAVLVFAAPASANAMFKKVKVKTVTGCVTRAGSDYRLAYTTKTKRKAKAYTLAGRDLASALGHRVQVQGPVTKGVMRVTTLKDLGRCPV